MGRARRSAFNCGTALAHARFIAKSAF